MNAIRKPTLLLDLVLALSVAALVASCGAARPRGGGGGDEGGDGAGGPAAEGEGEGAAGGGAVEGEGEGEGGGGGVEGEGEGEGNEGGEGEGEGGSEFDPPDPEDVDSSFGHCVVLDTLTIDAAVGFDLDGDGVHDNAVGENILLAIFANGELEKNMAEGSLLMLADIRAEEPDNAGPFALPMYTAEDTDDDPTDNFSGEEALAIDIRSFKSDGQPLVKFDGAVITDRRMAAQTELFQIAFPVDEENGGVFELLLYKAQMEADVDGYFAGLSSGMLGGAVLMDDLERALEQFEVPPEFEDIVAGFVAGLEPDVDILLDDGVLDALSIGLAFTAVSCEFAEEFAGAEAPAP